MRYSSQIIYSEDGAKNPFKGAPMKFLLSAFDAQSRVFSGKKSLGSFTRACRITPRLAEACMF